MTSCWVKWKDWENTSRRNFQLYPKENINRTLVKKELQFKMLRQQVLHRSKWIPCKWCLYINIWHYIRILHFNALQWNKCSKWFGINDFCFQWNIFLCVRHSLVSYLSILINNWFMRVGIEGKILRGARIYGWVAFKFKNVLCINIITMNGWINSSQLGHWL